MQLQFASTDGLDIDSDVEALSHLIPRPVLQVLSKMDSALLAGQVGVAGLGLAGFSAIHDLLHTVKAGLRVWEQWSGFDTEVDFFRAQIILQQDILETWQRDWFDFPIEDIASTGRMRLVRQHRETIEKTLRSIENEVVKLEPVSVLQQAQEDRTTTRRVKWIMGQKDVADATLKRIESLLNGLFMILPLQSRNPEVKFMISLLGNLGSLAPSSESLNLSYESKPVHQAFDMCNLRTSLERDLERRVKDFQQNIPGHSMVIRCSPNDFKLEDGTAGTRSRGIQDGTPVIIEWKSYEAWQGQKAILLRGRNDILARMLNASSKPEEMLTFHCKGYFDDIERKRYGFVSDTYAKPGEDLASLNHLLSKMPPEWLPSLKQRYQIAYSLGLTISIIHAVGWLHKGIRSHNIMFLHHQENIRWVRPYLCGFANSRPDQPDELSEKLEYSERFNLYRHPLAQGQPGEHYRQEYDIYSFGVLLFEIGIWAKAFPLWNQDAQAFRTELTSKASRIKIAHRLGTPYSDIMLKCLDGTFSNLGDSTSRVFYSEVVEVLGRLVPA